MLSFAVLGQPRWLQPSAGARPRAAAPKPFAAPTASGSRLLSVACAAAAAAASTSSLIKRHRRKLKPPASAITHFTAEVWAKDTSQSLSQAKKEAKRLWASMSDAEREPYDKKAAKDRADYEFQQRDPQMPKRPAPVHVRLAGAEDLKSMDPVKKKQFEDLYAKEVQAYKAAMDKYKTSGQEKKWKQQVGIAALEEEAKKLIEENKAKALKEKERLKAKAVKEKERLKAKAVKEKERLKALKEKERAKALREKERAKALKEKERMKAKALKEKERAKALKEKERAKALREKERAKALKEKERLKAKALKEKRQSLKAKALSDEQFRLASAMSPSVS